MEYDPQLFTIRSCIRALPEGEHARDCAEARSRLYLALQAGRKAEARQWAEGLRVALIAAAACQETTVAERELITAARQALEPILSGLKN